MTDFSMLSDYIIGIRRTLHKHPELSGQEFQTQQLIRSELDKLGIPHRTLHETDILAEIAGLQTRPGETTDLPPEKHSKTVLLRADLDALPITVFAIHVAPDRPTGKNCSLPGPCMAGVDDFSIRLTSPGGHGATPHLGSDTLLAGAHLAVNLQQIVSREIDPQKPAVLTIGIFQAGTQVNLLAQEAVLSGNIRFFDKELSGYFKEALTRYSEHTAAMYRCSSEVTYTPSLLPTVNDAACCGTAKNAAMTVWGEDNLIKRPASMTSEDFSRYLEAVPGAMVFLGTSDGTQKTSWPLHHECFDLDESALLNGCRLYAAYAWEWLFQ